MTASPPAAIVVRDLAKGFPRGGPAGRLRELLVGEDPERSWALEAVDLEVPPGETLGIVGANGAGKSTLLQILAGTTRADRGEVRIQGSVAAILELGTGLEPEFDARENILLLGSLQGRSAQEMRQRTPEILAFAELEGVADRPVKTYSTGMRLRLAFATLTATEPAVLLLDEALSVGDFAFRNRSLRRLRELKERGTTLVVVSHDLTSLQLLCDRLIWLDRGRVVREGDPLGVLQEYQACQAPEDPQEVPQERTGRARWRELELDPGAAVAGAFAPGDDIRVRFQLEALEDLEDACFALSIYRSDGDWVIGQASPEGDPPPLRLAAGEHRRGSVTLFATLLGPGDYRICLGAYSRDRSQCYALSSLTAPFSIRSQRPMWGRFQHPMAFVLDPPEGD